MSIKIIDIDGEAVALPPTPWRVGRITGLSVFAANSDDEIFDSFWSDCPKDQARVALKVAAAAPLMLAALEHIITRPDCILPADARKMAIDALVASGLAR
jgi:hypothetical protein